MPLAASTRKLGLLDGVIPIALYLLSFGLVFMFVEGVDHWGLDEAGNVNPILVFSVFALCLLAMGSVLFIYRHDFSLEALPKVLIVYLVLLVLGIIGLVVTPTENVFDGVRFSYSLEAMTRATYGLQWAVGLAFMFLTFLVLPKIAKGRYSIDVGCYAMIIIGLVSIIYSVIAEASCYSAIFIGKGHEVAPLRSFYDNENNYACYLMLCIFACFVVNARRFYWWHYIFVTVFYVFMIFTTSYITLGFAFFAFLIHVFYLFFITLRKHKKMNLIALFSILGTVGVIFAIILILSAAGNDIASSFVDFLGSDLDGKEFATLNGRIHAYEAALGTLSNHRAILLGYGYNNFIPYLLTYSRAVMGHGVISVDSAYLFALGSFGILGLVLYLALIGFVGYKLVARYMAYGERTVFASFIIFMTLVVYGLFETFMMFTPTGYGLSAIPLILVSLCVEKPAPAKDAGRA